MAAIIPIIKNGVVQSCKIRICPGKDELGKPMVRHTHWHIPEGVSESKAKAWEKEQQSGISGEKCEKKTCSGGSTMPLSVFIKEKGCHFVFIIAK